MSSLCKGSFNIMLVNETMNFLPEQVIMKIDICGSEAAEGPGIFWPAEPVVLTPKI